MNKEKYMYVFLEDTSVLHYFWGHRLNIASSGFISRSRDPLWGRHGALGGAS